jgi:hypothetical protein
LTALINLALLPFPDFRDLSVGVLVHVSSSSLTASTVEVVEDSEIMLRVSADDDEDSGSVFVVVWVLIPVPSLISSLVDEVTEDSGLCMASVRFGK